MKLEHKCSARCFGPRVTSWICPNVAKYERNGKWYCGIHDPERVAAREAKATAKYEAKKDVWKARREREHQEAQEAVRYLWLREHAEWDNEGGKGYWRIEFRSDDLSLDSAVDAAMAADLHAKPEDQAVIDGHEAKPAG